MTGDFILATFCSHKLQIKLLFTPFLILFIVIFIEQKKWSNSATQYMSKQSIINDITKHVSLVIGNSSISAFQSGFADSHTDKAARVSFRVSNFGTWILLNVSQILWVWCITWQLFFSMGVQEELLELRISSLMVSCCLVVAQLLITNNGERSSTRCWPVQRDK